MKSRQRLHAFTLIELLVVIVLAAILVGLLLPALMRDRKFLDFTQTLSNGHGLFQMLHAENMGETTVNITTPDATPVNPSEPASSTAYLAELKNSGKLNVDWSFFAAPGVPPAPSAGPFTAANNAWCVTLDVGENTKANVPFLFTKNVQGTALPTDPNGPALSGAPYGSEGCVVIYFGGGAVKLSRADLSNFNPSRTNNAILRP